MTKSMRLLEGICRDWAVMLGTAMMGLPGLSVPTGVDGHLPAGVQIVATRFREDRCLAVGELVESAARFSALDGLAPR